LQEASLQHQGEILLALAQHFGNMPLDNDVCFQKFMPEILSRGELSFVFIDGKFSHAVQKTVARNNWLAHEFFGGKNEHYRE